MERSENAPRGEELDEYFLIALESSMRTKKYQHTESLRYQEILVNATTLSDSSGSYFCQIANSGACNCVHFQPAMLIVNTDL